MNPMNDSDDEFEPIHRHSIRPPIGGNSARRMGPNMSDNPRLDSLMNQINQDDPAERLRRQREQRQSELDAKGGDFDTKGGAPREPQPAHAPIPAPAAQARPADMERPRKPISASPARANDKMADPVDRMKARQAARGTLVVPRGFMTVAGARKAQKVLWIVFGFLGFTNALITTILGTAQVWRTVAELPNTVSAPPVAYIVGAIFGLVFIAGSLVLAPSIWDRIRNKTDIDMAELCLYGLCVIPDTVFTGLFHWFVWIMPFMAKVFDRALLGMIIGLVLVVVIAVFSSALPVLAVLKNDSNTAEA